MLPMHFFYFGGLLAESTTTAAPRTQIADLSLLTSLEGHFPSPLTVDKDSAG